MEHVRTITREFQTGSRAVLHVEAHSGAVLVAGHDAETVRIEAILHIWSDLASDADEDADRVARSIEQDGHKIIVRAPPLSQSGGGGFLGIKLHGSRVDYQIRVPLRSAVRVLSRSGRIAIECIEGRVHGEVLSGKCDIENVRGDVTAVSRSGSVRVDGVQGNVQAEARSGRVAVHRVTGNATLEARSGVIEVEDVGGDVHLTGRTGPITVDSVRGALFARSRCGPFRYRGRVEGDFDIEVHTGPITLAVDQERAFFIDAESRIGPVKSDLAPRRGGDPASGGPKVRLRTHTGPIHLRPA